jgi:hypothetical protein
LAISAEDNFDAVVNIILDLVEPMGDVGFILYRLCQTTLPEKHPRTVALLFSLTIDATRKAPYLDPETYRLLLRLSAADPEIVSLPEFDKLARTGWFDL